MLVVIVPACALTSALRLVMALPYLAYPQYQPFIAVIPIVRILSLFVTIAAWLA